MEEMHREGMRNGCRVSMPSPGTPLSPNLHMFANLEALLTPFFLSYLWRPYYVSIID